MNQANQILQALKNGDHLTGLDILNRFQCMNFRDRILDLRKEGWPIKTTMVKTNSGKRVAQYSMERKPVQTQIF